MHMCIEIDINVVNGSEATSTHDIPVATAAAVGYYSHILHAGCEALLRRGLKQICYSCLCFWSFNYQFAVALEALSHCR